MGNTFGYERPSANDSEEDDAIDNDEMTEQPETREIDIKPVRSALPEVVEREYAFKPSDKTTNILAICNVSPSSRPPLIVDYGDVKSPAYDMGPERCGKVHAYLRVVSVDESESFDNRFDIQVPLKMLKYKTPSDPAKCFNISVCHSIDRENDKIEEHNKYITSLLSLFVHYNGCGTSAGHVTLPSPPDNMAQTLSKRIKNILDDKYGSTILAVRYLKEHDQVCERDYKIEDAVKHANNIAFLEGIREKRSKAIDGKIRFRISGSPPALWDGNEDNRDSQGRRVKFCTGKYHTFISPDVTIELANDELISA